MESLSIGDGTLITLHFALRLNNGDLIDTTFDKEPAQFTFGDGNLLEGFEQALIGLTKGAKKTFLIEPEAGFGQANPNNIQQFPRDQFDESIQLEAGLMLSFADAQNAELPGVVIDFDQDSVTVDFNHPLAGKSIEFEVEIINVSPAVQH